jgi:hypothetical protein
MSFASEGVSVDLFIMVCISLLKPWVSQQDGNYISWKHIMPNVVSIPSKSIAHHAFLFIYQDFYVILPCDGIRMWICPNLKLQFKDDFL